MKTQTHTFKNSYSAWRWTCDIQKDINVWQREAAYETKGLDYKIDLKHSKKRHPAFTQSKAKQFALWDEGKCITAINLPLFRDQVCRGGARGQPLQREGAHGEAN